MVSGWILVWRQLREHPFWRERRRFSKAEAWLDLLLDAAFEDHQVILGNTTVAVKRGQALISQRDKARQWRWARNSVASFISLLEKLEMVSREVSRGPEGGYTLLTIKNYEKFQSIGEQGRTGALSHGSSHALSHDRATIGPRLEPYIKKGKEGKRKNPVNGLSMERYVAQFPEADQEILRQMFAAIARTRKTGQVAPSVLNALARKLLAYPGPVVLRACQVYLDKDYAGEGKNERYLLGIVRGECKRTNRDGDRPDAALTPKTPGQLAIERAVHETLEERGAKTPAEPSPHGGSHV